MSTVIDLSGRVFGRLTVVSQAPSLHGHAKWFCKCECGTTKTILSYCLIGGYTKSCGCFRRQKNRMRHPVSRPSRWSYDDANEFLSADE